LISLDHHHHHQVITKSSQITVMTHHKQNIYKDTDLSSD